MITCFLLPVRLHSLVKRTRNLLTVKVAGLLPAVFLSVLLCHDLQTFCPSAGFQEEDFPNVALTETPDHGLHRQQLSDAKRPADLNHSELSSSRHIAGDRVCPRL